MTRHVLYVAHPLAPTQEDIERSAIDLGHLFEVEFPSGDERSRVLTARAGDLALRNNLQRALRWLAWLRKSFPETTFIAPWIASVMSGDDDSDPKQREAGLVDDCAVVERCDGIVLCGGRISSGMQREREHGRLFHQLPRGSDPNPFKVYNLTWIGSEPPKKMTLELAVDRSLRALAELR